MSKNTRNQMLGKFLNYDNVDRSQAAAYSMGHVGQIYLNMAGAGLSATQAVTLSLMAFIVKRASELVGAPVYLVSLWRKRPLS